MTILNPDNAMMMQSEGHWQKYLALAVLKYEQATGKPLVIRPADIQELIDRENNFLLTHGHVDSIEFRLVSTDEAARLKEYAANWSGSA